jgi:hypothetical protein
VQSEKLLQSLPNANQRRHRDASATSMLLQNIENCGGIDRGMGADECG